MAILLHHRLLAILGILTPLILATAAAAALPALPLRSSSRWILDANNTRLKLRCVNWAGHMETHIPEGLQHHSIDTIADWIASRKEQSPSLLRSSSVVVTVMTPAEVTAVAVAVSVL